MRITYTKNTRHQIVDLELTAQTPEEEQQITAFIEGKLPLLIRKIQPDLDLVSKTNVNDGIETIMIRLRAWY
jgi:hypothetical protein